MRASGLAHRSLCAFMLPIGIHRQSWEAFEAKLGAWGEGFLGEAPRPEEIEDALAIAGCFPPSKRLVASSPTAERNTMANEHMAFWRANTMGICGAMPPPLSGKDGRRSSHRKTGCTLLSLTSDCPGALAEFFDCNRGWSTC